MKSSLLTSILLIIFEFSLSSANIQISKSDAMSIAAQVLPTYNSWTSSAVVKDAFPMYLDGIDGISYWECKITSNGADAGYIVVNANQTDIITPEACPTGKTRTEQFNAVIPNTGFQLFRYGPSGYLAVSPYLSATPSASTVLASAGFSINGAAPTGVAALSTPTTMGSYPDAMAFRNAVIANGCYPAYTQADIQTFYGSQGLGKLLASSTTPTRTTYLAHSLNVFTGGPVNNVYTPLWNQYMIMPGNHYNGCASTAWAMVLAYWWHFKGATSLFGGLSYSDALWTHSAPYSISNNDQKVYDCLTELFTDCNSLGTINQGQSATLPSDVPGGIGYAQARGYNYNSYCNHTSTCDFNGIFNEIANDRPVIMYYCTADNYSTLWGLVPDHYIVIDGAQEFPPTYIKSSLPTSVSANGSSIPTTGLPMTIPNQQYLANFGWAENSDSWIPMNGSCHDYYSINLGNLASFSFYSNVTKGKAPLAVKFTSVNMTGCLWSLTYSWAFGDGATSTDQNPVHTFTKPGTYTVILKGHSTELRSDRLYGLFQTDWSFSSTIKVYSDLTPILSLLLGD